MHRAEEDLSQLEAGGVREMKPKFKLGDEVELIEHAGIGPKGGRFVVRSYMTATARENRFLYFGDEECNMGGAAEPALKLVEPKRSPTEKALYRALLETVEILEANTLLDTCLGFDGAPCQNCVKEKAVIKKAHAALNLAEKAGVEEVPCGGCKKVEKRGVEACCACGKEETETPTLEKRLLEGYYELHDGLSDMIEEDRVYASDIPDDYDWLVNKLEALSILGDPIFEDRK
jgi:hypothetical protein